MRVDITAKLKPYRQYVHSKTPTPLITTLHCDYYSDDVVSIILSLMQ